MRTPDQIVNAEVYYCVSSLVSTLANGALSVNSRAEDLYTMAEQAFELACPIDDWEEAALQAGWTKSGPDNWTKPCDDDSGIDPEFNTAREACEFDDLEPYQREVFEHWIVSDWLADQLEARGEKVDKDFAGMIVWARTTTGQGIASDSVIEAIAADLAR